MFSSRFIGTIILSISCGHLYAQDFSKVDEWLQVNTLKMGGRAVLMVEKDGRVVYSRAVNEALQ